MSQSFYESRKRPRLSGKTSGKCGEITFCMQVGIRVYALKCLFCPQICIQWDDFINHIEEVHDEELRSDNLLQQEIGDANVDAKYSKETASIRPAQLLEAPQVGRIRVRSEFNKSTTSAEAFSGSADPLMGNEAQKPFKTEHFDNFELRVFNAAHIDDTCDSTDYQKPFDSVQSHSETDSDLEATNALTNFNFRPDKLASTITKITYVCDVQHQLPSTEEIKKIPELQTIFNINVLENKHRTILAKGLISFILNKQPERRIVKQDFLRLAQSIVEIFPTELRETYYVPHSTGHRAKGKLFDAYNNTRTRFSVAGLIRRGFKSKPEDNAAMGSGNSCATEPAAEVDESELSVLKSEYSEWDLVLAAWKNTHSFRQHELKSRNLKTHEYIEKYKVLLHENNYDLFDIDFKMLYPMSNTIYKWKFYYPKIIAKAEKIRDTNVRDILTYINDTEEKDSKLALSLMLIAYILPNPRQKASKLEIQESFISYFKDITEAEEDINDRSKRIKLEEQPKVYLIGDSSKTICEAFVDICGKRLTFKNPIKAIEVCFYCFMVMNIKYPKYIAHVWIFIQKLIYEVNTPWDCVIPAINTIINDLRLDKFQ